MDEKRVGAKFAQVVDITPAQVNGTRLDNCLRYGQEYGQVAADYFCRQNTHQAAASFETAVSPPTLIPLENRCCREGHCLGFTRIVCR